MSSVVKVLKLGFDSVTSLNQSTVEETAVTWENLWSTDIVLRNLVLVNVVAIWDLFDPIEPIRYDPIEPVLDERWGHFG